jgi:hypothetical protein
MKYSNNNYQRCWQAMSARWYPVRIKAKPQLLSCSPTSIITVITSSLYGIALLRFAFYAAGSYTERD